MLEQVLEVLEPGMFTYAGWCSVGLGEIVLISALGFEQGDERELVLEEVNKYLRAIQYQQLEKPAQFGAAQPPGFYVEARAFQQVPRSCQRRSV